MSPVRKWGTCWGLGAWLVFQFQLPRKASLVFCCPAPTHLSLGTQEWGGWGQAHSHALRWEVKWASVRVYTCPAGILVLDGAWHCIANNKTEERKKGFSLLLEQEDLQFSLCIGSHKLCSWSWGGESPGEVRGQQNILQGTAHWTWGLPACGGHSRRGGSISPDVGV